MAGAQIQNFRPGDNLFHEGQPSDSLFIIQKGTVAIRKRKSGGYIEIAKIYSNEVLGELSFFDKLPRSASAVALTEVEALRIDFRSMDTIFKKIPAYLRTIMMAMAERLRRANDTIRKLQKNVQSDTKEDDDSLSLENEADISDAGDVLDELSDDAVTDLGVLPGEKPSDDGDKGGTT